VVSLGILKGADTKASQEWVKFLLTDGYARWCFMTPGGKTPVRKAISDEWQKHEIFSYYGEGMAERLSSGMDEMKRWGYVGSNWFPLMKDIYGMKVVPEVVGSLVRGKATPEEAAAALRQRIERLRD
jgi:multiple sugar transport system substrate-binding protein